MMAAREAVQAALAAEGTGTANMLPILALYHGRIVS
jgi:hypothetical protein